MSTCSDPAMCEKAVVTFEKFPGKVATVWTRHIKNESMQAHPRVVLARETKINPLDTLDQLGASPCPAGNLA